MPSTPYATVESVACNELKTAKQCIVELQGSDLGTSLFIPSPGIWVGCSNGAADAYILTPKATFNNTGKIYLSTARIGESATLAYVSSVYYR